MCLLRKTEAESRSAGGEVVLCQDWAKPLRAFGCPLGPQQDPAEFVAQLVGLLGPKWLQVAGVQRTEVKALVPQCSCYGANLVETSRITAAETCVNLYLPDASSTAEQSLNDLLRDNTLSARASGQRCPLCLQDITQREQTTYGCEDVVREHGRKPVRADKVTLPDRMWPDEANTEYELRAVVCRSGASADSGHYVAFVRGAGSSWICYDDGVADAKRQPQLEMQRACRLIVYERTCETVKTEQPDRAPLPSTSSQWPQAGLVPDARLLSALGEPAVGTEADATMYPAASSAASEHGSERARVEDSHVGGKASANECEVDMEELERMPVGEGQDALERDARALLETFESGRCCRSFLSNLPLFRHEARSLSAAADAWHAEFADLCEDTVNGATAMHVQPYLGDTALYPLLVLLQASSWTTDMPAVFYVDVVHALVSSILHKELHVRLNARWNTRNRYWTAATADIGQGKSPAMQPLFDAMERVLRRNPSFAVGAANDNFHFQQASTTASAVLKLRQCNGYLTMFSDESGLCLSPALATGGCTDAAKHVDLPLFLNAAHGGLFSWSNRPDRERALKAAAAPPCPSEAVPEAVSLTLAHTNVHFVLIGQEDVFAKFWAQLAHAKQIGLAQRFLLSFGVRQCTACTKWNAFFQSVTLPILEQLFTIVLHRVGPHTPARRKILSSQRSRRKRLTT